MDMYEWVDPLRFLLCLLFLLIASIYDIRTREVPNWIWAVFAPTGLALTLTSLVLGGWSYPRITMLVISAFLTICLSLALFYIGMFGGADAKALMCLAAAMPIYPEKFELTANLLLPMPPISTFNNAVLAASLLTFVISFRNLIDLIKHKGRIFEGLEKERLVKKIAAFITGFRVDAEKIRDEKHHYILLEEFSMGENGKLIRRLKILRSLNAEEREEKLIPKELGGKVWVTMGLPFLVFIMLGFLTSFLFGDIIFWLITAAAR
ncbi:MAG: A24 family peptidase C-terminal domain-containing protein [Candidatus Bathyarchaeia archaeon]